AQQSVTSFVDAGAKRVNFVCIGGGPASDAWNAMLKTRAYAPGAFRKLSDGANAIPVHVTVLDPDPQGFAFGENAVGGLKKDRLHDLNYKMERKVFNWSKPLETMPELDNSPGSKVIITAEGSLFHYADDEDVVKTLRTLNDRTPADAVVIGSAYRGAKEIDP